MDTTFYEDSRFRGKEDMMLKRPMTLDLGAKSPRKRVNTLLTSPDLNMLKLGSPELEKLIMAQHTSLIQNQCMYPTKADDRDQQYSSITDALNSLQHVTAQNNLNVAPLYQQPQHQHQHQQSLQSEMNNLVNVSNASNNCNIMPPSSLPCSTSMVDSYDYQQPLSSINMNCNPMISSTMNSNCYAPNGYYSHEPIVSIKEEPQTVPCMEGTPPQSPIDMDEQEKMKLERKRLRNRIAASKCRKRKLEKIANLEQKVQHLKNENSQLMNSVTKLKECICTLKQQVLEHVRSGCEILVHPYHTEL